MESKRVGIYAQLSNLKMDFKVEFVRIKCREMEKIEECVEYQVSRGFISNSDYNMAFFFPCWFREFASSNSYVLFYLRNTGVNIF